MSKKDCWGAQLGLLAPITPQATPANTPPPQHTHTQRASDPEPWWKASFFSLRKAVSLSKLRVPTLCKGSRVEGSKVNYGSLGWKALWWQVVSLLCQQRRSNRPGRSDVVFITLSAGITTNLSSVRHRSSDDLKSSQMHLEYILIL